MKKVIFILVFPLLITSCLKEGSNYISYTGYINIDMVTVPDTARVGDLVEVFARGGAPNGCWSDLELFMSEQNDSVIIITGIGHYESTDGICTDIYQILDSTFTYKAEVPGKIKFVGQSPNNNIVIDSLIVIPAR
jgi:hypothetical protein